MYITGVTVHCNVANPIKSAATLLYTHSRNRDLTVKNGCHGRLNPLLRCVLENKIGMCRKAGGLCMYIL